MHGVVHADEVEAVRRLLEVRVPAVKQHRDVVVPVQEDEGLLPQHDEDRVAQFRDLKTGIESDGDTGCDKR